MHKAYKGDVRIMQKTIALVLTIGVLSGVGGVSDYPSSESSNDFNLVEYLDTHKIQSLEEFQEVIELNTDYSVPDYSMDDISDYDIDIDYDNNIVCVTTVEISSSKTDISDSASKDYYNEFGALIFSIHVSGTFRYSYYSCTVLSKSGGYSKPAYSYWSSTPTIGSGNFSASEAYVGISGTAICGGDTYYYSLTMTCDNYGNINIY